jgi:hypothetical protein
MLQPDLQRLFHGVLLRFIPAGTAAIPYPGKIAVPQWSFNGVEREERRREKYPPFRSCEFISVDLFYLLYRSGVLLSGTPQTK